LSAINEANQLNRNGLYKIGFLSNSFSRNSGSNLFTQAPTPESLISLETELETESIVEAKSNNTNVDKKIVKNKQQKKYNYEKLNELKSVLMLVARKTGDKNNATFNSGDITDERIEDDLNEMDNLDYFIEIFDNIVVLADVLLRLVESGCWVFENALIKIHCDIRNELKSQNKPLVEIELSPAFSNMNELLNQKNCKGIFSSESNTIDSLKQMCRFSEDSLAAWLSHVESVRDQYNLINFFTIKQITYLKSYFTRRLIATAQSTPSDIRFEQIQSLLHNLYDKLTDDFLVDAYKTSFAKFDLRAKRSTSRLAAKSNSSLKTNSQEEYVRRLASENGFRLNVVRDAVVKYGGPKNEGEIFAYCFEHNDDESSGDDDMAAPSLDVEMNGVEMMDDGEIGQIEFVMKFTKGI
jgi:hypothetical protein